MTVSPTATCLALLALQPLSVLIELNTNKLYKNFNALTLK